MGTMDVKQNSTAEHMREEMEQQATTINWIGQSVLACPLGDVFEWIIMNGMCKYGNPNQPINTNKDSRTANQSMKTLHSFHLFLSPNNQANQRFPYPFEGICNAQWVS
jgi:hypothetical protein